MLLQFAVAAAEAARFVVEWPVVPLEAYVLVRSVIPDDIRSGDEGSYSSEG